MSIELKPCPFCGDVPHVFDYDDPDDIVKSGLSKDAMCENEECPINGNVIDLENWNTRAPLPSALREGGE